MNKRQKNAKILIYKLKQTQIIKPIKTFGKTDQTGHLIIRDNACVGARHFGIWTNHAPAARSCPMSKRSFLVNSRSGDASDRAATHAPTCRYLHLANAIKNYGDSKRKKHNWQFKLTINQRSITYNCIEKKIKQLETSCFLTRWSDPPTPWFA